MLSRFCLTPVILLWVCPIVALVLHVPRGDNSMFLSALTKALAPGRPWQKVLAPLCVPGTEHAFWAHIQILLLNDVI